ncbi:hypothetical protein BDW02DRAFT_240940 [Decorospora gaudefroyi]|uniref:Uncharacterized protein n=1 Tax=Decorospora gaudefroyi TaxID=184978 RepID=A0A6A5KRT2_9PLEO|nr:hypothetical protein BDW02DRAFT_240940 [Decorospora gaudefroyi]
MRSLCLQKCVLYPRFWFRWGVFFKGVGRVGSCVSEDWFYFILFCFLGGVELYQGMEGWDGMGRGVPTEWRTDGCLCFRGKGGHIIQNGECSLLAKFCDKIFLESDRYLIYSHDKMIVTACGFVPRWILCL